MKTMPLLSSIGRTLLGLAAAALAWKLIYWAVRPPAYVWPSLEDVVSVLMTRWELLATNAGVTALAVLVGFFAAVVFGGLGAIALHVWKPLKAMTWPVILFSQVTPKVAIAPILLVWFGYGLTAKFVIAFLIAFFPVLLNTYAGLNSLPPETRELAASLRTSRFGLLFRFEVPHALPSAFAGARIAMTLAVVGAVIAEFVGSNAGLGRLVLTANSQLNTPLTVAAVLVLGFLGLALYGCVVLAEARAIPWHVAHRRQSARAAVAD